MEDKEKKLALQKAVGERVYHSRKLARMSKEELAERLGISSQYVNDIEQGKKCMSMAIFVELGEVFHTGLDELPTARRRRSPCWSTCSATCASSLRCSGIWPFTCCIWRSGPPRSWARRSRRGAGDPGPGGGG